MWINRTRWIKNLRSWLPVIEYSSECLAFQKCRLTFGHHYPYLTSCNFPSSIFPPANRTCSRTEFTCVNNQPPQRKCIPRDWVCDGDADCADALDEHQNCTRSSCGINEFTCSNGLCIRTSYRFERKTHTWPNIIIEICQLSIWKLEHIFCVACILNIRCDRRNDCGDSSDEQGCTYQPCQQHQFTCQNGRCVSHDFVCDGDNDCGDESDELEHMCRTTAPTCPPGEFRCENGHCVPLSKVCDRNDDCSDNSDEKGCGEWTYTFTFLVAGVFVCSWVLISWCMLPLEEMSKKCWKWNEKKDGTQFEQQPVFVQYHLENINAADNVLQMRLMRLYVL